MRVKARSIMLSTDYTASEGDAICPSWSSNRFFASIRSSIVDVSTLAMNVVSINVAFGDCSLVMRPRITARCTRQFITCSSAITGMVSNVPYSVVNPKIICAMLRTMVDLKIRRIW